MDARTPPAHACTHARAQANRNTNPHTHTHTHTHAHTHAHMHARTHARTRARTHTLTRNLIHAPAYTYAEPHAHTQVARTKFHWRKLPNHKIGCTFWKEKGAATVRGTCTCRTQHATMQRQECNTQRATCSSQHTACSKRQTYAPSRAPRRLVQRRTLLRVQVELNIEEMVGLFCRVPEAVPTKPAAAAAAKVQILDLKRANNVSIVLARFKSAPLPSPPSSPSALPFRLHLVSFPPTECTTLAPACVQNPNPLTPHPTPLHRTGTDTVRLRTRRRHRMVSLR